MCVFWCVCAGLWSLITPRWILISVWWDTKDQSQSTNALAANHFNEYILFWPLSRLFFVFHITFPLPHYSLSVLGLFCIHTLPFNSPSHPVSLLSPPSYLSFSLTHRSPRFLLFLPSLTFSLPRSSPFPSAPHLQLKPATPPQSCSWGACTRSCPRSKAPSGRTRIRVTSCTRKPAALAASAPLCPCQSPLTQPGTTPAPCNWKMGRPSRQRKLWRCPMKVGEGGMVSQTPVCFLIFFINSILWAQESRQTSCQLNGDNQPWMWMILKYVLHEAFCCAFKPSSGQFICQTAPGLQEGKATDRYHMLCFFNVVKEFKG